MKKRQRGLAIIVISVFALFIFGVMSTKPTLNRVARAQKEKFTKTSPTPVFDQKAALAKLREQIKGREKEPAGDVFEKVQIFKKVPAERFLQVMEFAFAQPLGVNCTHCHTPENWSSEEKPAKQISRDMRAMNGKINRELLKEMKSLGGRRAFVTCVTCHRGQVKPAIRFPQPKPTSEKGTKRSKS